MADYKTRCALAATAQIGDVWVHRKTGKKAEIIGYPSWKLLKIRHESGRISTKQEHYFAGDFEPITKESK